MRLIAHSSVKASIPPGMPEPIKDHILDSLEWIKAMEDREQGDPRQIQATLHGLMATIEVYNLAAETARQMKRTAPVMREDL